MKSALESTLDQTLLGLQQSPLFQLSLASKELFHSNFLAWLCTAYPKQAGRIFGKFFNEIPTNCEVLKADRERKNIDLTLDFPEGFKLIVENKVKSLPTLAQLEEYADYFKNDERAAFLLLSLTRPPFMSRDAEAVPVGNATKWHFLSYRGLARHLQKILPQVKTASEYHGYLLGDYIDFISRLDALQSRFILDWESEQADFYSAAQDLERLKKIRMHDVFDKLRFSQLAGRVMEILKADGFQHTNYGTFPDPRGAPGQMSVQATMTNGEGLFDLKYVIMKNKQDEPVLLGVQVQGRHFRLNVEMKKVGRAEKIASALLDGKKRWFDFKLLGDASTSDEYPQDSKGRTFNQYSGPFFYRSKKLTSISPKRLAEVILEYARFIRRNKDALRRQIESVL